ncbi:Ubiquitin-like domain-containing protein [Plasmodiophora brassicae]|uniref:Ubiquitin-like domain-containing protein n=1 Tax=Plasmodiophora brassicae TaxID=37360 RepID=A0A0G4IHE9_PLABS|nr:hypothetical protein PBRA_000369 [Plasmodiophora brassicae]SPQ96928.1 unnamed protein product [Plasmodiophora brassicae]
MPAVDAVDDEHRDVERRDDHRRRRDRSVSPDRRRRRRSRSRDRRRHERSVTPDRRRSRSRDRRRHRDRRSPPDRSRRRDRSSTPDRHKRSTSPSLRRREERSRSPSGKDQEETVSGAPAKTDAPVKRPVLKFKLKTPAPPDSGPGEPPAKKTSTLEEQARMILAKKGGARPASSAGTGPKPAGQMIEVILNDRLGTKTRVKCCPEDTVGQLKQLVAMQIGRRPEKIRLQKWYTVFKDHITLDQYEIHDGMSIELYYN